MWGPAMRRVSDVRPLQIAKFAVPPYAGIEQHVDTLARALMPEMRSTVLAGDLVEGRNGREPKPYKLYTVKCYGQINSVYITPRIVPQARSIIGSGECNLLHVHCPNPWGDAAALTCKGVPVVLTWHSDIVRQKWILNPYRFIQQKVIDKADRIIVTTPDFAQSSRQLDARKIDQKISYIPLGIDFADLSDQLVDEQLTQRINTFAAGRSILLTVGRHVAYKGYKNLLLALATTGKHTCLVMVGSGPLTNSYIRIINELALGERVLILHQLNRSQLATAYRVCDFFVLPSISPAEAFGLASAEAMAFGKPTIVCRLNNGVDYLNQHMVTSLCVTAGDVPELSDAIATLAMDHKLREVLGSAARQRVRCEFSISNMKKKMSQLYQAVV
jgi:glycosyltransferase involved in cell wall biosynthesis